MSFESVPKITKKPEDHVAASRTALNKYDSLKCNGSNCPFPVNCPEGSCVISGVFETRDGDITDPCEGKHTKGAHKGGVLYECSECGGSFHESEF